MGLPSAAPDWLETAFYTAGIVGAGLVGLYARLKGKTPDEPAGEARVLAATILPGPMLADLKFAILAHHGTDNEALEELREIKALLHAIHVLLARQDVRSERH